MLERLQNPFIIPLLMNCRMDNPELISSQLPCPIQENQTFIIDLNSLAHRKDIFCDDKRSRVVKGNREKLQSAQCKDSSEADISVRRQPYACKFCPQFHKIIVTIEYGKLIKKWFPLVLVHQYREAKPRKFKVASHGNRKLESLVPPYLKTKESTKQSLVQNLLENKTNSKRALFKMSIVVRFVALRVRVLCQEMHHRSTSQNISWDSSAASKVNSDPLMAVLDLQKGSCS